MSVKLSDLWSEDSSRGVRWLVCEQDLDSGGVNASRNMERDFCLFIYLSIIVKHRIRRLFKERFTGD